MKITMLSEIDYAGSGHKLCEAISKHTDHDIKLFTGLYHNPYGHPDHSKWNKVAVQKRINESDIVHLKGDTPPKDGYLGLKIMHKPIVITVGGSHFRKKYFGGYEKFKVSDYAKATLRTAFTPDLCYEGFDVWTPHPIDCSELKSEWSHDEPPVLMHIPSRRDIKATDFVYDIFSGLRDLMEVKTIISENIPFSQVINQRKRSTIYFDQFKVGFYGNSAIEAMAYGIPVACWIRDDVRIKDCPVITEDKDVDKWVEKIYNILKTDMLNLSVRTKFWCNERHSYESVARQWNDLYELVTI